jgi:glycosyltransferase involved in cell wall biosynthesis
MKKIKLLTVCSQPLGGIRTFVKYHLKYLPKDKFEVNVLAAPSVEKKAFIDDMKKLDIEIIWSAESKSGISVFFKAIELLKNNKYDLIYCQGYISAFWAALANKFFRLPHILTIQGIIENKRFKNLSGKIKRQLFGYVLKDVTLFHFVTKDISENLKKEFPKLAENPSDYFIYHSGIDTDKFKKQPNIPLSEIRAQLKVPEDTFLTGYFGRFMPEKGFGDIIEAARLFRAENPENDIRIMAVGTGDFEREYKIEIEEKGLSDMFFFLPFMSDISDHIKICDVVLMPSRWEAFGILAAEVLCLGTPLIASTCTGLREAVQDTPAITVQPASPDSISKALKNAVSDNDIKNRFINYRPEALKRYDSRQLASELEARFTELAKK